MNKFSANISKNIKKKDNKLYNIYIKFKLEIILQGYLFMRNIDSKIQMLVYKNIILLNYI